MRALSKTSGLLFKLALTLASTIVYFSSFATTYTAVSGTNLAWGSSSSWNPTGVPGASDAVIIGSGSTVVVSGDLSLTGNGTSITINSGGSLNVSGSLSFLNKASITLNSGSMLNAGTLTVDGGIYSSSSGSITSVANFSVTSSGNTSFTNGGSFSVTGTGATTVSKLITNTGTLSINGALTEGKGITNSGTLNIAGTVTATGAINNTGTINIGTSSANADLNGDGSGSSVITNDGILNVYGKVSMPSASKLNTNPGGTTIVTGSFTTNSNQNLVVGTSASPPPYADVVIEGDLISSGSGDVLVDKNGRLAVWGNFSSSGSGGSAFKVNDGGEVYLNGTITFSGGGDHLTNNNDGNPYYGFYSNHQPTYPGGGSSNGTAGSTNSVQPTSDMNQDFYDWVTSIPGSPLSILPITLTYFKVSETTSEKIALAWSTATEINFEYFSLQKSADGNLFNEIAQIKGHGTTNRKHDYEFEDKFPLIGKNYYRLTSVDFDNHQETFHVIVQEYKGEKDFQVSPNPSDGQTMTLNFNFDSTEGQVVIYDNMGLVVTTFRVSETGQVSFINPLKDGIYFAKYSSSSFTKAVRFLVKQ